MTTTVKVTIREPIWNGGRRCVGVATFRLNADYVEIVIDYRDKAGKLVFPEMFRLKSSKAKGYPRKTVRNGVELVIIPIEDLDILGSRF